MRALLFLLLIVTGLQALAATPAGPTPTPAQAPMSIDDQAIAQFLSNFVYVLDQPAYVWNWFNQDGRNAVWKSKLSATDPAGFAHLQSTSLAYWQSFCSKNKSLNPPDCGPVDNSQNFGAGNVFGPGLYLAVDPVATISFGGGDGWVLMQVRLPKGLRIMDLRRDGQDQLPMKIQQQLLNIGCPQSWTTDNQNGFNDMLSTANTYLTGQVSFYGSSDPGKQTVSDQCVLELRKILKDDLKIDGFYYSYTSTEFKECDLPNSNNDPSEYSNGMGGNNPQRQGAFVLANSAPFTPDDVRVFNAKTIDDKPDRIRIQSLFYKADVDSISAVAQQYFSKMQFPGYAGYTFSGMTSACTYDNNNVATCKPQIMLCPPGGGTCISIDPPSMPPPAVMPAVMSTAHPPASMNSNGDTSMNGLLWSDLNGVATDTTLSTWVVNNLFGCQAAPEYDPE